MQKYHDEPKQYKGYLKSALAVARINGIRYERRLVRLKPGAELDGIADKLASKYGGGASAEAVAAIKQSVANGNTWIFELATEGILIA